MKRKVLFVGSFQATKEGRGGGQNTACQLILDSELAEAIDWVLFDTTQSSNAIPSLFFRGFRGIGRLISFVKVMLANKIKSSLIFTSFESPSMVEKGFMLLASSFYMNNTIVSIRSEVTVPSYAIVTFIKLAFRKVNTVVCQSEAARASLRTIIQNQRTEIVVIPNWIDISKYPQKPYDDLVQFDENRPLRLLYVGWLESSKGLEELFVALNGLVGKGLHIQLSLFGDGTMLDSIQRRITNDEVSEVVHLHGWVSKSDLIEAYSVSDVFILPSHSEGMPNSVLEAMAIGLPILATNVGGIPELVSDNVSGILFGKKSAAEIELAIENVYSTPDLIAEMGKQGRRLVESKHDFNSAMSRLKSILII